MTRKTRPAPRNLSRMPHYEPTLPERLTKWGNILSMIGGMIVGLGMILLGAAVVVGLMPDPGSRQRVPDRFEIVVDEEHEAEEAAQ